jgi:non-homologous end joining protein Ku/predicted HicB family RNase H-like nuclease
MSVLRYKDYQGAVEFDDGRLIVRLLHIDDLITTEIDRASEAQAAFTELVDDYLASCVEVGKQASKPFKGSFNVRVPPNLHKRAAFAAMEEGETLNAFVLSALENKLVADGAAESPPATRIITAGFLQLSLVTCPIALVAATSKSENTLYTDATRSTSVLEINHFVPRNQIDHLYLASPYYVIPDGTAGQDAYAVIRESIRSVDKVAIAHVTSADQQHVMALEARESGLLGTLLRYPHEIREASSYFDQIPKMKITKDMLDLAKHIIDQKSKTFDPNNFPDQVEHKAVQDKIRERHLVETRRGSNVIDLMKALKGSLSREKALRPERKSPIPKPARKD